MPANNDKPWGLIVPGRPPTPSEGAAQTYSRVGPPGTQKTRTFDNGTCLTFGPQDLVDEFDVYSHPFHDQVVLVDTVIRDCRAARRRYEGSVAVYTNEENEEANDEESQTLIKAGDPFNAFRQGVTAMQDIPSASLVQLESGMYRQIPSKHASCANLISTYSVLNKSDYRLHPGLRQDTRFGVTCKPFDNQNFRFRPRPGPGNNTVGPNRHVNNSDGETNAQVPNEAANEGPNEGANEGTGTAAPSINRNVNARTDRRTNDIPNTNRNVNARFDRSINGNIQGHQGSDHRGPRNRPSMRLDEVHSQRQINKAEDLFCRAMFGYRATGASRPNRALSRVIPRPRYLDRGPRGASAPVNGRTNPGQLRANQLHAERYHIVPVEALKEALFVDVRRPLQPPVLLDQGGMDDKVVIPPPWLQIAQVNGLAEMRNRRAPFGTGNMVTSQYLPQEHTSYGYGIPSRLQVHSHGHALGDAHGMHPGMQIAPQDQSFGNGYEMQSFPLPNMSTTAINPLQQTGGNDRGMHSRLQGPSQGQTFGSGYDMHSFPLHEMSAASVKEPLHELEGSALAGYIPTSLVVHKANTASRTRSAGGNRIQAQANTDYTQMFDEENAEYKKRGEVPLQSDILSGGTILKAQRGIGNSMVVNQSSSYRQDNKIATKEAAKTETAKEPAKMPEKPSRPMTYKEDYERRCRAASEARRLKEIERMQAEAMALEISNLEAVRVEQATNQAARFQIPPAQGQFSAPVLFPGFGQEPRQPQGFLSVPRPMFPRQDYMPTRTDRLLGTLAPINTSGPAVDSSVSLPVSPVHRARSGLDEVVSKLPRHVVTRVASQNTLQANSTSPSLFYQREELAARLQNAANNYTQRSRKGDGGASQAQIRS